MRVRAAAPAIRSPSTATRRIQAGARRSGSSIQEHGIDWADAGDTVLVGKGTYAESPSIGKSLTLQSTGGRDDTKIVLQTGPTYLGALSISGAGNDVTVDGFTIVGRDGTD